VEKWMRR